MNREYKNSILINPENINMANVNQLIALLKVIELII